MLIKNVSDVWIERPKEMIMQYKCEVMRGIN